MLDKTPMSCRKMFTPALLPPPNDGTSVDALRVLDVFILPFFACCSPKQLPVVEKTMTHLPRTSLAYAVVIACLGVLMTGCGEKENAPASTAAAPPGAAASSVTPDVGSKDFPKPDPAEESKGTDHIGPVITPAGK